MADGEQPTLVAADSARGSWVRTVYGYTSAGAARYGWVRLIPGKVDFTTHTEPEGDSADDTGST